MEKQKQSQFVRGWNFGNIKVHKDFLELDCMDQNWMQIQYSKISNVTLPATNDLEIEFNHDEGDDM